MIDKLELVNRIKDKQVIIYGAHLVAMEVYRYISTLGIAEVLGFAVTNMQDNPKEIDGVSVKTIYSYENIKKAIVIIAVPRKYFKDIREILTNLGASDYLEIDQESIEKLKGENVLEYWNQMDSKYFLYEDEYDKSWLNIATKNNIESIYKHHLKFPTAYYLKIDEIRESVTDEALDQMFGSIKEIDVTLPKKIKEKAIDISDTFKIYMVFSQWDNGIRKDNNLPNWIVPIQAGSMLTDNKIGKLYDEIGDNISNLNRSLAELTITYWIWKNDKKSLYKGLCHYRRHFVISEKQIDALIENDVEVLLTTPRLAPGGIEDMFIAETPAKEKVFETLGRAVSVLYPEDIDGLTEYLNGEIYCPNNMVVAKNELFNNYCEWLFPLIFKMLELDEIEQYGHENDRHIAYLAELLTSYYFLKKRKHKYSFVDYRFL